MEHNTNPHDFNPDTDGYEPESLALEVQVAPTLLESLRQASGFYGEDSAQVLRLSAAWDLTRQGAQGGPGELLEARAEVMTRAAWATAAELGPEPLTPIALPAAPIERRWLEPVKFAPFQFPQSITVADAFRWIGRQSLVTLTANLAPAIEGDDPEGIHQARVAIRRLRSVLKLFKPVLARDETLDAVKTELRWLAGEMGDARDLDVMSIEYLVDARKALGRRTVGPLAATVELARVTAQERAAAALTSARCHAVLGMVSTWLETDMWSEGLGKKQRKLLGQPLKKLAPRWLGAILTRVRRKGTKTNWKDTEQCHDMRKEFKVLRYSVELLQSLLPTKQVQGLRKGAKNLQDILGYLNDVDVADMHMERLLADAPRGHRRRLERSVRATSRWHHKRLKKRRKALKASWKEIRKRL